MKTLILCHNNIAGVQALAGMTKLEELNLQCNQLCKDGYGEDKSGLDGLFKSTGVLNSGMLEKLDIWGNWSCREHTDELYAMFKNGSLELGFTYSLVKGFVEPAIKTDANGVTWDILYDILIKQNGDLQSDWTGDVLDVEKYRAVTFEPYDLRVLNGTIDF